MRRSVNRNRRRRTQKPEPCVLWLTGFSGSGKSAIADLLVRRMKKKGLNVEHLDGDTVRMILPGTGFDRNGRNEHIRRAGYLASVLERNNITVIASFISPYRESRDFVRSLCRHFVEIHVATPLAVCEERDPKGLYRKARAGEISHFTGIDDPYETPAAPELTIDTSGVTVLHCVRRIEAWLDSHGTKPERKKTKSHH